MQNITRHMNVLKNILRLSKIDFTDLPKKPKETTFAAMAHASKIHEIVKKRWDTKSKRSLVCLPFITRMD